MILNRDNKTYEQLIKVGTNKKKKYQQKLRKALQRKYGIRVTVRNIEIGDTLKTNEEEIQTGTEEKESDPFTRSRGAI